MKKNQQPLPRAVAIREHEQIVVGSSLEALLYAFKHQLPVFYTGFDVPFRFDHLLPSYDLSCLGLTNESTAIATHDESFVVGAPLSLLWDRLLFILSLAGLSPLSNLCENIRCDGDTIVCSNEYSKIAEIRFGKMHYFGDDNCTGIIEKVVAERHYICYDWIAFNRGGKHEIDYIETEDEFVKQIWFYSSDRIDGKTAVKDACTVSHLSETQLREFDFSETMARFKLINEMETRGMKGLFNGYCPKYGHAKYYKFRTSNLGRKRIEKPQNTLPSSPKITIAQEDKGTLIESLPESSRNYQRIISYL